MLDRTETTWKEVRAEEVPFLRECLLWLKTHNPFVNKYCTNLERFGEKLGQIRSLLPEGNLQTLIRISRCPKDAEADPDTIKSILNNESTALAVLEVEQFPKSWADLGFLRDKVGSTRLRVQRQGSGGESVEVDEHLQSQTEKAAEDFSKDAYVKLSDSHLDAKCFSKLYPYGTGSPYSEEGSGGLQNSAKQRATSLDPCFRQNPVWAFWSLDGLIKSELFFKERGRRKRTAAEAGLPDHHDTSENPTGDVFSHLFGRIEPRNIPESGAWWRSRQRELLAICQPHELEIMSGMVRITQNDKSPELLANARRGPCAKPTESEMMEHLLLHDKQKKNKMPNITKDALVATLSFQRRTHAFKQRFLTQNHCTPLGVPTDYWDRTEAQTRQALHSHIPFWIKRRKITHTRVTSDESLQGATRLEPARDDVNTEDTMYRHFEMARVHAELIRPDGFARWSRQELLWAFLLRSIQTQMYLHFCFLAYCLKGRSTCRFFFLLDKQDNQKYNEEKERVALRRRHPPDDQWVVPHNIETMAFSPSTINIMPFDPEEGADQARLYACKYCGKPETWYYLEAKTDGEEANPVKKMLQQRNIGSCMALNRLMGFRMVRSTRDTKQTYPKFVNDESGCMDLPGTMFDRLDYLHLHYFLTAEQKYFFRPTVLRDLRVGQFHRYFSYGSPESNAIPNRSTNETPCRRIP